MMWNFSATISTWTGVPFVILTLLLYFVFVFIFMGIVVWLVVREGRTLRKNLEDEVLMGNLSKEDLDLICSPIGRIRAKFRGKGASTLVKTGIRLGMAKWHAARAMKGQKQTLSIQSIVPLRQELIAARQQMYAR